MFFFFKQKTAYEMRISDWSSDVCSSDLHAAVGKRFRYRYRRRSGSGAAECRHVVARVARRRRNRRPRESRFRATCGREKEMRYRFPTLLAALLTLVGVGTVAGDRKSVVEGKRVSVRVDPGGRSNINKKK